VYQLKKWNIEILYKIKKINKMWISLRKYLLITIKHNW
jgi:hypothetical protein